MNKKIVIGSIVAISSIVLLTVGFILASKNNWFESNQSTESTNDTKTPLLTGPCTPGDISIEGYTEKGKQLSNCFVQYPGEPSREDKSYYIVEDICGQFTKEFVENVSGENFVQIQKPLIQSLYNCTYFINTTDGLTGDYLVIQMEYLSIENQKKGHEFLDRTVEEETEIPMRNYVVYQEDGNINCILLGLSDNKYIRIDRSSSYISNEILKSTAINIAKEIKEYK